MSAPGTIDELVDELRDAVAILEELGVDRLDPPTRGLVRNLRAAIADYDEAGGVDEPAPPAGEHTGGADEGRGEAAQAGEAEQPTPEGDATPEAAAIEPAGLPLAAARKRALEGDT